MEATSQSGISNSKILKRVIILFAIWRISLFAFDFVGMNLTYERIGNPQKDWQAFPGNYFLDGWFRWDGGWYKRIAENGYYNKGGQSNVNFFPLYSYLSRILGKVTGNHFVAGLLISNISLILSLFFFFRLGLLYFNENIVYRACILLLVFPGSFFLSAYYTESLFLAFTVSSVFYFMKRNYLFCGVLGLLAMLTRPTGIILVAVFGLPLFIDLLRKKTRFHWSMLFLALVPCGYLILMLIQYIQVGDPLAFLHVQAAWGKTYLFDIDLSFPRSFSNMMLFFCSLLSVGFAYLTYLMIRRKYQMPLWLYTGLGLVLPLSVGVTHGMVRHLTILFPAFFLLSELCEKNKNIERFLIYSSAFFLCLFNLNFMNWYWAG